MIRKVGLAALLLGCVTAAGCKKANSAAGPPKPPDVIVAYPVREMITDTEEFPGRIDAVNTVQVKARAQGYLASVHFVDGQEVEADDVLAIIQQDSYDAALKAAKAQVALQEANIRIARITLSRAETSGIAASPLEIDQDRAQLEQADASLKLAQANQLTAQLNYDWTFVRSPINGRISRRMVDPGNVVVADGIGGANATIITTVVSLDPVYVYFDIDERTMLRLERLSQQTKVPVPWKVTQRKKTSKGPVAAVGKAGAPETGPGTAAAGVLGGGPFPRKLGLPVSIGLSDEDNFTHEGVMNFADNVVNRQTGTLRVRGEFENPGHLLTPGMYCRVQVPIGAAHPAVLVHDSVLGTDQGRKYVFVVDDEGVVSQRDVKVGALHDGLRVVEGLGLNERVVVEGLQRVKPKLKVNATVKGMPREKTATDVQLANSPAKESGAKSVGK